MTTFAGTAGERQVTNGTGTAARFYTPTGLVLDAQGNLIVADTSNNVFRKITSGAVVSVFSGSPINLESRPINVGSADGAAADASFHIGASASGDGPYGEPIYTIPGSFTLGKDSAGNIYFADTLNYTIRMMSSAGAVTTIAGSPGGQGTADGAAAGARFLSPGGVAADVSGTVYVADSGNNTIRKISGGQVTTLAGAAGTFGTTDGVGAAARFLNPSGIALDAAGNLYVSDTGNHTIRKVTSTGVVTTLAGSAGNRGTTDGGGTQARFSGPTALTVDATGYIYVADSGNHAIRKVSPSGVVSTVAGTAGVSGSADGTGTSARFLNPSGITVDASGTLYISDTGNNTIRRATAAVTTDSLQVTAVPAAKIQVTTNTAVTMKVVATGSPAPTYQWYKDGVAISGANSATYSIGAATNAHTGFYNVVVTSGVLTYTSPSTQLQVFLGGTPVPSVVILSQPTDRTVTVGQTATFTVDASSSAALTYQWMKNGVVMAGETNATLTIANAQAANAATYTVDISDGTSVVTTSGASLLVTGTSTAVAPSFTTHPSPVTVALGGTATFSVAASGTPAPTYQWQRNGVALSNSGTVSGANTATLTITGVATENAGTYTVIASNLAGAAVSNSATLTIGTAQPTNPGRIINLSALTSINAGENFTFGFYLGGAGTSGTKPLLMRAMGPSLAPYNVANILADPTIEFYNDTTKVSENNDWSGSVALRDAATAVQAFPFISDTSKDAAIYNAAVTITGQRSIKVAGAANASGNVIAELYDATPTAQFTATTPRLINVSLLKNVGSLTTLGFTIGGSSNLRVLIRAVGPTLAAFNVAGAMSDPQMDLYVSGGTSPIATNDNWNNAADVAAAGTTVNAFGLGASSKDAAMVQTLAPGGYTVQVKPATGTATGQALIEIYEVP